MRIHRSFPDIEFPASSLPDSAPALGVQIPWSERRDRLMSFRAGARRCHPGGERSLEKRIRCRLAVRCDHLHHFLDAPLVVRNPVLAFA